MGSTSKELVKISIQRPGIKLTSVLEKNGKICMPITETGKVTKKQELPGKAESKAKLTYEPVTKKAVKHLPWEDACLALCKFPESIEDAATAAKLLLLVLLSQTAHLLLGIAPMVPAICLDTAPRSVLTILSILLCAVQGPEQWQGKDWKLLRPWVVRPRLSLCETTPSSVLSDYIGGKFQTLSGKKRTFCYPYIDSTVALAPGLPTAIEKALVGCSPLSLPIVFGRKDTVKGRTILEWKAENFVSYDTAGIEQLKLLEQDCYLEITLFLQWLCEKEKRLNRWKDDFDIFRPVTRRGRFTTPVSDDLTELLCAALALFRQYLVFASEKNGWITQEKAQEIMFYYWRLVLPESAPQEAHAQVNPVPSTYDTQDTFYQFLTEHFLPTYQNQILIGAKGVTGTMAAIRKLDGDDWFVTPRKQFLEAYARWLSERQVPAFEPASGAEVQRLLQEAGIPLRGESGNPVTWRYSFYAERKDKVDCLALPIKPLPEWVKTVFGDLIGIPSDTASVPTQSEPAPDGQKEAEVL